jgi:nucleolar GTP-binding protein
MAVRNAACEALLAARVEQKLKGNRINAVANRIHVAMPVKRDDVERAPFIPETVKDRKKYDKNDPDRIRLERDAEQEADGVAVFMADTKSEPILYLEPFTDIR